MDQQQIEKLRAAGYTDDDIRDFVANQPKLGNAPTQTQVETLPEIDVTKPSDTLKQAEAAGIPTGAKESSFISDAATLAAIKGGQFAVENPMATAALGAYGASYIPGVNKLPIISGIRDTRIAVGDIAQRAMNRANPPAPGPAPIGSPTNPIGGPVVPQGPATMGPVVPQGTPAPMAQAATKAPSLLDKTTSMIRQLAANKVMQGLSKGAGVLGAAQMAAYSPELGPKTPQVGRMRGMEINPLTNRPWTPQQIAQYEANPNVFDQQMAPPQMRR